VFVRKTNDSIATNDSTLVVLSPGFAANEKDTSCLPLQQELISKLKEAFPSIQIFVLAFQYPFFPATYAWKGITVKSFNGRNRGKFYRFLLWSEVWKSLKQLKREKNIIGVLSFWYGECAFVANRFAQKYSIKHYCWMLGQDAKPGNKYVRFTGLKGHELIALSDFLQSEFEKNYGIKPFIVVPPGVCGEQLSEGKRDIDLLGVGALIPLKQFEIFIETVAELKKQIPGVKAVLIGEGPEKDKLNDLILHLNIQENIVLASALPHQDVLALMERSRILLHPSSYEGFGVVCVEALRAGAHVISFVQPMRKEIDQWHVVPSKKQMLEKTTAILKNERTSYSRITFQSMQEVAQKIGGLFLENV
jgi:glycosyltransferase involved in cell wall biosynthesis